MKSKSISLIDRRTFLKILLIAILAFSLNPKNLIAEDTWKKRKLIEIKTDKIIEEYGIKFRIYKRKEPGDSHFFEVKYMLDSKKYVKRVFWGDWADKILAPKDSIIMIYDPEAPYTKKHWDYIRQEKIFQIFVKKYLKERIDCDFDLYEINMEGWSKKDKLHLASIVDFDDDGYYTVEVPTLIIISDEIYNYLRAPPMSESEIYQNTYFFEGIIKRKRIKKRSK